MASIKYIFSALAGLLVGIIASFFIKDFSFFKPFFEVLLIASVGSLASFFLDFAFREGNIFAFWIRFLNRYFHENKKNPFRLLYKPLGACAFCLNIWLTIGVFFSYYCLNGISIFWLLPATFFSHLIIFFLFKHFDLDS